MLSLFETGTGNELSLILERLASVLKNQSELSCSVSTVKAEKETR